VKRGRVVALAGAVAIAAAAWASPASAATLLGDYQLQGTRSSAGPGPALFDIASGNAFQSENVMGTTRQVLSFPRGSGVQMTPSVGSGDVAYSVVTTFRLNPITHGLEDVYPDVRILDQGNGTTDSGFYSYYGQAKFYNYPTEPLSPDVVFSDNAWVTVAITSLPPALSRIYVNGSLAVSAAETLPVVADTLRFFKDDHEHEQSPGAVSCIRVYGGALTDDEVAAIGASPTCQAPTPATSAVKKTCKKHKKKHKRSSESAKKKKCKKKRKKH
jgi:hypothetical protein